jgi:hypothetical protein
MPDATILILPVVRIERAENVTPLRRRKAVVVEFRSRLDRELDEVLEDAFGRIERPCDCGEPPEVG